MHCPALNLFAKCHCSGGIICPFCIRITLAIVGILLGAMLTWKPRKIIEMQAAFYKSFNWKIEPISMKKEIKNMRIMGLALGAFGVILLLITLLI